MPDATKMVKLQPLWNGAFVMFVGETVRVDRLVAAYIDSTVAPDSARAGP